MKTGLQTTGKGKTLIPEQSHDQGQLGAGQKAKAKEGTIIAMHGLKMANVHME